MCWQGQLQQDTVHIGVGIELGNQIQNFGLGGFFGQAVFMADNTDFRTGLDFFADIEIICLANTLLKNLIPNNNITLNINTLGTRENLSVYKKTLSKFFNDNKKNLSKESLDKINTNPLRILDSKNPEDSEIIKNSPKLIDLISKKDLNNYEEIKKCLTDLGITTVEDPNLVRGLDYYCHTVFEFKTNELGSQDTLIGGGRYNGLIKTLGGKDLPGVGWAGGIERIMLLMKSIPKKHENDTQRQSQRNFA